MGACVVEFEEGGGEASAVIRAGEQLQVRLAENPSTGYRWQCEAAGPLRQLADRYDSASHRMGSGGTRVLIYQATAAGPASLRLAMRRAWNDAAPVAAARIQIRITG